ncbi:MAG: glycosyltransferase [Amaricoccus sp.]|uniref:glycosyltransferase family 2 protein n=1 Tax=Amaricoccus sp. TaxID=1872485 RepID=UPI0039E3D8E2
MSGSRPMMPPRLALIVASRGRPDCLARFGERLAVQTRRPDRLIYSVADSADLPPELPPDVEVITGGAGLAAQRNRALERVLGDCEIVAFFDDDFVPSCHALEGIQRVFLAWPDVVGATGRVIADGVSSAGIPLAEAEHLVDAADAAGPADLRPRAELDGLYGCNMAFRAGAIGTTRFDERLPLYGWQEDVDFAARLRPHGRLVLTHAFGGVHCGVKSGRTPGLRLGYSQVANPVYLARKGSMRPFRSARLIAKNLLANHLHALSPEPWVDRRGRVRGNWLALVHALSGQLDPEHVLRL